MKTTIKILRNERNTPPGKLADAELHFSGGELDGLKLIGFAVWRRRDGVGQNVTFPARQFTVHGEKRSFALLRAIGDPSVQDRVRELVLQAYAASEEELKEACHLRASFCRSEPQEPLKHFICSVWIYRANW